MVFQDKNGKPVKPDIKDNGDGTFTISYVPTDVGQYTVLVTYGGKNVPASPFSVKTSPTGDASKCSILGKKPLSHLLLYHIASMRSLIERSQNGEYIFYSVALRIAE